MAFEDYAYEEMAMESYYWSESVEDYLTTVTLQELLVETRKVLHSLPYEVSEINKIRSILIKGIANQSLSDKQRYVLGDFILTHQ